MKKPVKIHITLCITILLTLMDNETTSDYVMQGSISFPGSKNTTKIRVGIMLDTVHLPAWYYSILDSITKSDYATLELVIFPEHPRQKTTFSDNLRANPETFFYTAYTELENRLLGREPDAFAPIDAQKLLQNVPKIVVQPQKSAISEWIEKEDVEKIKEYQLDVILPYGFGIFKGDILDAARYGLWSYYHDDTTVQRGGPPGFWATFERRGERGAILQVLTEDVDKGMVIYRSSFPCYTFCVSKNNNHCFLRSSLFVPRLLKRLYNEGENAFFSTIKQENKELEFYDGITCTAPSNLKFLRAFIHHTYRIGVEVLRYQFVQQQWMLMYDLRDQISTSFWRFKKILPPKDRFWTDPHIFFKDDTYYIFIEECIYKQKKGHISVIEMQQSGKYSDPVRVLDEPFHLSYPHVFDYNGTFYMIPETSQANSINLYQCTDFPTGWKHRTTLMDSVNAVDSTILFHKNKWWLFTNISEPEGTFNYNELFLFYSDNLLSNNWHSHPMNPVLSDVKRARSAGKIFEHHGILYRPSQCCVPLYGYGVKLNEIVTLTEKDYREREIAFIEPNWDKKLQGVHTFCHENRLTMH